MAVFLWRWWSWFVSWMEFLLSSSGRTKKKKVKHFFFFFFGFCLPDKRRKMKRKKRIPTNTTAKTAARHTRSPSVDVKLWMIHRPDLSVALDISIQTVLDVHTKLGCHTKTTTTEEKKTTSSCPGQQTRDDGPDSSAQSPKRPAIFLFLFDPAHHRNLRPTFYFAKLFFFSGFLFDFLHFCVCVCVCAQVEMVFLRQKFNALAGSACWLTIPFVLPITETPKCTGGKKEVIRK
jgi:hypothetical protein